MTDDFYLLNDRKNIWVSVSGGTDSALLLYFITKYCYENKLKIKITPWTTVDLYRPGNDVAVEKIINCIQEKYPYPYEKTILNYYYKDPPFNKTYYTDKFWHEIKNSNVHDVFAYGITSSPPIDVMKNSPEFYTQFLNIDNDDRTPGRNLKTYKYSIDDNSFLSFAPFINFDKSYIAKKYEEEDLMDTIFPLTQSCIAIGKRPCYNCFWCMEKHWAFGLYDMS